MGGVNQKRAWIFVLVVFLGGDTYGDIGTSLGRHRLSLQGKVLKAHKYTDTRQSWIEAYRGIPLYEVYRDESFWPLYEVVMKPTSPVAVYDVYDFHKTYDHDTMGNRFDLTTRSLVYKLTGTTTLFNDRAESIVSLLERLGMGIHVEFRHHEAGVALVENGLAHTYKISGDIRLQETITCVVSSKLLTESRQG